MIISPYLNGFVDQPVFNITKEIKTDIPIIQLTRFGDFVFDDKFYDLDKYILCDFLENGANSYDLSKTLLFGKDIGGFKQVETEDWQKFHQFVKDKAPVVYFKRELLTKDVGGNIHTIDFACVLPEYPIQSKLEFDNRKIELINWWGYSHEIRRIFQSHVFLNAVKRDKVIIDNLNYLPYELDDKRKIWISTFTPHYARYDKLQLMEVNGMAKISVSMPGSGICCFRHTEASANSVMLMRDDPIEWSYSWEHNKNCIKFQRGNTLDDIRGINGAWEAIEAIEEALQNPMLYDIYVACVENCNRYRLDRYCREYLEPIINLNG